MFSRKYRTFTTIDKFLLYPFDMKRANPPGSGEPPPAKTVASLSQHALRRLLLAIARVPGDSVIHVVSRYATVRKTASVDSQFIGPSNRRDLLKLLPSNRAFAFTLHTHTLVFCKRHMDHELKNVVILLITKRYQSLFEMFLLPSVNRESRIVIIIIRFLT